MEQAATLLHLLVVLGTVLETGPMASCFEVGCHYPQCTVTHAPCSANLCEHTVESLLSQKLKIQVVSEPTLYSVEFFYDFVSVNGLRDIYLILQDGSCKQMWSILFVQ